MLHQEGAYGAHSIAMRIKSVSFLPGFAIAVAASTLTGQYLGLGDPQRARQATYLATAAAVAIMSFCSIFFFFTPEPLVALLSPDTPEHLALAPPLLRIAAPVMPMFAVCIIIGSAMQGAGDTKATAVINFSGLFTTRLVGAYLLAFTFGLGLNGIWIGMMADLGLRGIVFLLYYRTGRWAQREV
jgi:Na+-driven multidrug efflux pump